MVDAWTRASSNFVKDGCTRKVDDVPTWEPKTFGYFSVTRLGANDAREIDVVVAKGAEIGGGRTSARGATRGHAKFSTEGL
jgi:hypothetical protein